MSKTPSLADAKWLRARPLRKLFKAIAKAGGEARVAGGAVRNTIMGLPVHEVDVATTLSPEAVTTACAAAGLSVHPTGIDHGTVTVVADHHPYEVTTLRHDVETDGRWAKVAYTNDWQADAMRRDFTMNALYCDEDGKVYDYTNGYRDALRNRIIFVGDPRQRIQEDYLRILRFFRFHARFGKGQPDEAGLAACVGLAKGLDLLSPERIRQEMFKLLEADQAVRTLKLMHRVGILSHLIDYKEEWRVLERLPVDSVLRLSVLAADPVSMQARWRLSNAEGKRIEAIHDSPAPMPAMSPREQRIMLYRTGAETWRDLVCVAWARSDAPMDDRRWKSMLRLPDRWPIPKLPVTGRDLIDLGVAPGPKLGATLRRIEDGWMASDFQLGKSELLARLNT